MVKLHFRNFVLFTLLLRTESEPNTLLAARKKRKTDVWAKTTEKLHFMNRPRPRLKRGKSFPKPKRVNAAFSDLFRPPRFRYIGVEQLLGRRLINTCLQNIFPQAQHGY